MKVTASEGKFSRGFTLVELLAVITIMTILASISAPLLMGSNQVSGGLQTLGGALDLAREYAVSKNTYVWVLVLPTSSNAYPNFAEVGLIASKDGTDTLDGTNPLLSFATSINLATASNLELVEKIRVLPSILIKDSANVTIPNLPVTDGTDSTVAQMANVNISVGFGGQTTNFSRAIEFTPTGEVRTSLSVARYIEFAVLPQLNSNSPDEAVLCIAELTGKTTIYRK